MSKSSSVRGNVCITKEQYDNLYIAGLWYRGSCIGIEKPNMNTDKYKRDFGGGFYLYNDTSLAQMKINMFSENLSINSYLLTNTTNLSIKVFDRLSLEWLTFVEDCRNGIKHNYDIVVGPCVDPQIWNLMQMYMNKEISSDEFLNLSVGTCPITQLCVCTERAFRCVKLYNNICIERDNSMYNESIPMKDDIRFMCYVMEVLSRHTDNRKSDLICKMDKDYIMSLCPNKHIYATYSPKQLANEQIEKLGISDGLFSYIWWARYNIPSPVDMACLYSSLIYMFDGDPIDNFIKVMSSPICDYIDDYNSSLYYENLLYIRDCIEAGRIIKLGLEFLSKEELAKLNLTKEELADVGVTEEELEQIRKAKNQQ